MVTTPIAGSDPVQGEWNPPAELWWGHQETEQEEEPEETQDTPEPDTEDMVFYTRRWVVGGVVSILSLIILLIYNHYFVDDSTPGRDQLRSNALGLLGLVLGPTWGRYGWRGRRRYRSRTRRQAQTPVAVDHERDAQLQRLSKSELSTSIASMGT